jgi:hypothetical protein
VGTERFERSTSPKEIQLYRLARPTDIRLMPIGWRRERDSNAHVLKDAGLANRWDTYYPTSPITRSLLKIWRRVGDSNSYAPKLRRFSGPVGHHLPIPSVWWLILVAGYRVERSLRLFKPTLSPDQIQPALSK